MIGKKLKYTRLSIFSAALMMLAGGCSAESEEPELPQPSESDETGVTAMEISEATVRIMLGTDWEIDDEEGETRAAPPGAGGNSGLDNVDGEEETENIDKIRVVTFRREDPDAEGASADAASAPFLYDSSNDLLLDAQWGEDNSDNAADKFPTGTHRHKYAEGTLKKIKGYEYRLIAIAYSSTRKSGFAEVSLYKPVIGTPSTFSMPNGEDSWFTLNLYEGLTLDEFKATINSVELNTGQNSWCQFLTGLTSGGATAKNAGPLSYRIADIPQFFYGECYATVNRVNSETIKYSQENEDGKNVKNLPIKGILYRGMAKVELHIVPTPQHYGINYPIEWVSLLADNVYTEVNLSDYDGFLNGKNPIPSRNNGKGTFSAIAYSNCNGDGKTEVVLTAYLLPCKTRLAVRLESEYRGSDYVRNAQLTAGSVGTFGNPTGVISPDLLDGYFYLRRNHKYVLKVSDSEALIKSNELK